MNAQQAQIEPHQRGHKHDDLPGNGIVDGADSLKNRGWRLNVLSSVIILVLLVAGAVGVTVKTIPFGSVNVVVPVAPGRRIHLLTWKSEQRCPVDSAPCREQRAGPPTVALFYHTSTRTSESMQRLAVLRLPNWPLFILPLGMALVTLRLWTRRRSASHLVTRTARERR